MSVRYDITAEFLSRSNYRQIHAGDDYSHQFTVRRSGAALPLSGAKLWFTVKADESDLDSEAELQYTSDSIAEIEITDALNGQFTIHLRHADTDTMAGTWSYDIQALLGSGEVITLARGVIEFLPNLTRVYA